MKYLGTGLEGSTNSVARCLAGPFVNMIMFVYMQSIFYKKMRSVVRSKQSSIRSELA